MITIKACPRCHDPKPWDADNYPVKSDGTCGYICLECKEKELRDRQDKHFDKNKLSDMEIRHAGTTKQRGTYYHSNIDLYKKPEEHPTTRELLRAVKARLLDKPGANVYSRVIHLVPLQMALEIYLNEIGVALIHRNKCHRAMLDKPLPSWKWELCRNILVDCMDSQEFEMGVSDGC